MLNKQELNETAWRILVAPGAETRYDRISSIVSFVVGFIPLTPVEVQIEDLRGK